jgi:hypothetical protein
MEKGLQLMLNLKLLPGVEIGRSLVITMKI